MAEKIRVNVGNKRKQLLPMSVHSNKEEPRPPYADVPMGEYHPPKASDSTEIPPDKSVRDSKERMARKIETGGSPYDYTDEVAERKKISGVNIAAVVSFIGLFVFIGAVGVVATDLWEKIDSMNATVMRLSEEVKVTDPAIERIGKTVVRAELAKAREALRQVASLGDPAAAAKAKKLQAQIDQMMVEYTTPAGDTGSTTVEQEEAK